jgi:pimeloyl-ACP methyl ester carboxylesterase
VGPTSSREGGTIPEDGVLDRNPFRLSLSDSQPSGLLDQIYPDRLKCVAEPEAYWYPQPSGMRPNLVLFSHGFMGESVATWGGFPSLLQADPQLGEYDFCFWGYPSSLNPIYLVSRLVWSDNPDLDTLGLGLRTFLDNACQSYKKIILVAHSMGGLIVQLFILQEITAGRRVHLNRLTEVVLYGTPSGGLVKANLVDLLLGNDQAADMGRFGPFIKELRAQWKMRIDDRRATDPSPFRLTLVAGMMDKFVPQTSSLDPFPFDEKEIVPGNHTQMVKPASALDLCYLVLRSRLLRGTPSQTEREILLGESTIVIERINRVRAAAQLYDVDDLVAQAASLLQGPVTLPLVERVLGLALLDNEVYSQASVLLKRYVGFSMPGSGDHPFGTDAQALQQLAIALSGAGEILEAVTRLEALDPQLRSDPETLGILAGRFKRQWLKTESKPQIGYRAYELYMQALDLARKEGRADQVFYNGVNAAYLRFALGEPDFQPLALEILDLYGTLTNHDYWSEAMRAECLLLLGRYPEARQAYEVARRCVHEPRHWASTGQQALDILKRLGEPQDGAVVASIFQQVRQSQTPSLQNPRP